MKTFDELEIQMMRNVSVLNRNTHGRYNVTLDRYSETPVTHNVTQSKSKRQSKRKNTLASLGALPQTEGRAA